MAGWEWDEQSVSQLSAQPVFNYASALFLLHAGSMCLERTGDYIDWLHLQFLHVHFSAACLFPQPTERLFWTLIYIAAGHSWQPSSLLTSCPCTFQVQKLKATQSRNVPLLSALTNSPLENSCEGLAPVIEQKISRRSRSFKKSTQTPERVSASPKQNDNCQVQWLLGCHRSALGFQCCVLQTVYALAF